MLVIMRDIPVEAVYQPFDWTKGAMKVEVNMCILNLSIQGPSCAHNYIY